ncbi:META domain-containing protein [Maridesulfovibrio sp. FT414]|uniref:META domain-containing protein n=1 Tax=Maridesulfovibrio sp. FT414 TaxID=2979469 RepID=UPI003D804910
MKYSVKLKNIVIICFLLWLLIPAGCAPRTQAPQADFVSTRNTKWVLEDLDGLGVTDFAHIWVRFDSDGKIYGSGGCNSFRGYYSTVNSVFKTGPLATTRKACSKALNIQEFKVMQALENVQTMYRKNGMFYMEGGGHVLRFSDDY